MHCERVDDHGLLARITARGRRQIAGIMLLAAGAGLATGLGSAAQAQSGLVFTANERGSSISVVEPETGQVETTGIRISPHNVQTSSDGRLLLAVGSLAGEPGHGGGGHGDARGRLLVFRAIAVSAGPVADNEVGRGPAHVIVDREGARAFVTNSGDNSLSLVDLARQQVVRSIAVGSAPHGLRVSPDGRTIHVANTGDGTVSVVSIDELAEVARIPVGKAPVQVGFTPDGRHSYVSLRDENSTAVIDTANRQVIAKIPVGPGPIQLFATPNGREVYVANQGTEAIPGDTVSIIDTASRSVAAEIVTGAGAHGVVVSSDGSRVFVANTYADTVSVIDPASRGVVRTIPVGAGPGGITFGIPKE